MCAVALMLLLSSCRTRPGTVQDEAMSAGRAAASFPAADEDYFHDMDGGVALTPDEVKGRNTWIVWTGGNDRFWDTISVSSFGSFDLLKTISSHSKLKFKRANRFEKLGLSNDTGYGSTIAAATARPTRSRTRRNIRVSQSARAERMFRLGLTTANQPEWWVCGFFQTPTSMKRRRKNGIRSATTKIPLTTCPSIW
jgi:hypothetical protein